MGNTVRKLQNEETFKTIKEQLDVSFANPQVMLTVAEKAIAQIAYWEGRAMKGTPEYKQICAIEIAKLEALMQRMTDLSLDAYDVQASAYLDAKGFTPDKSVAEVLIDVAADATQGNESAEAGDAPVLSIETGDKVLTTPTIGDLKDAVKSLLKKGHFDSAMLLGQKHLGTGDYLDKKGKPGEKRDDNWIASWIKDLNVALMEGKRKDKKQPVEEPAAQNQEDNKEDENAAAKGLTNSEVEKVRLITFITGTELTTLAEKRPALEKHFSMSKELFDENTLLTNIHVKASRIPALKEQGEAVLAAAWKDFDDYCKAFFLHRPYTEKSVKAWRETITTTELGMNHYKYLTTGKDVDPTKLKKNGISYEAIINRVKEEYNDKTIEEIAKSLEEGLLYTDVRSTEDKQKHAPIYTKLHVTEFITGLYNAYKAQLEKEADEMKTKTFKSDKVDIEEVKARIATMIENGAILDDVHKDEAILSLINREIIDGKQAPAMKFGNETTLFGWLDNVFAEIDAQFEPAETTEESPFANLDNMLLICETAAKNDVTPDDFIRENKDLVIDKNGKYKSMKSQNKFGGSKTIVLSSAKDFETWVNEVYAIQAKLKEQTAPTADLATSMKELKSKGEEILKKGTTYEQFIEWLSKNLLNRKMMEQKASNVFKTIEAIIAFAKNTFKDKLPKPAEVASEKVESTVGERTEPLTAEEIHKQIGEMAKEKEATPYNLVKALKAMYEESKIPLGDGTVGSLKVASEKVDEILKDANPEMYKEVMQKRAERQAEKEKTAAIEATQTQLPFTKEQATPIEENEVDEPIVGEVADAEHVVFERVDVSQVDPALWETIKNFKSLEEVHSMAVEFNEAGKFNEALSMCLTIMPQVAESKDWTPEQITLWFNTNILNKKADEPAAESAKEQSTELGEEFKDLMESSNKKTTSQAIMAILKAHEDNKELRQQILTALKTGKGAHTRTVGKMPDGEIHKFINNQKEKIGKYAKKTEGVEA